MTSTMKGLLKGLRYISQIFDGSEEEEPEMQIGNPTDVKHVAHIGWDGPTANSPSWINDYKSPNESSSTPSNLSGETDVFTREPPELSKPKHFKSVDSSSPDQSEDKKQSRRRHSAGGSLNSPGQEKPKKHQHHSSLGLEPTQNNGTSPPSIPKKSKKKKSKDKSTDDGSTKSGGGSNKPRAKGRKKSDLSGEVKLKLNKDEDDDEDSPSSTFKALELDDKKDYEEGIPRDELDL